MLPLILALAVQGPEHDAVALGDDDWRTRTAAAARLERAGLRAVPSLLRAERSRDAEVSRQARMLLWPHRRRLDDAQIRLAVLWVVYAPDDRNDMLEALADDPWAYVAFMDAVVDYCERERLCPDFEAHRVRGEIFWRGDETARFLFVVRWRARTGQRF